MMENLICVTQAENGFVIEYTPDFYNNFQYQNEMSATLVADGNKLPNGFRHLLFIEPTPADVSKRVEELLELYQECKDKIKNNKKST